MAAQRRRARARRGLLARLFVFIFRVIWRFVRVLLLVGAAMGPGMPPPPPPSPPPIEQRDDEGELREDR